MLSVSLTQKYHYFRVDQNDLRSEDESVVTPEVVGRGQLSKLGLILAQEFVSSHI